VKHALLHPVLVLSVFLVGADAAAGESICPADADGGAMARRLTTQIDIDAPAELVWQILLAFDRYPEWNPFVKQISGTPVPGGELAITVQPPGRSAMSFEPVVLVAQPARELRWLGSVGLPRIFDGEHSLALEPRGQGGVRLIHAECFRGVLLPFLWSGLDTDTRSGFEQMNRALKERAEKSAAPARTN
jgi:hypothetical protein